MDILKSTLSIEFIGTVDFIGILCNELKKNLWKYGKDDWTNSDKIEESEANQLFSFITLT